MPLRVAFGTPSACASAITSAAARAARAVLNVERVTADTATVSWGAVTSPARISYVLEYGRGAVISRRATLQQRIQLRNLSSGTLYGLRVRRADTGAEVATGSVLTQMQCTPISETSSEAPAGTPVEAPMTELSRLEVRVGVIVSVERHPDADSLYVEQIDVGEESPRTIVSGLVRYCSADELKGRRVIVLCNLKPRAMRGVTSHGMLLCASDADHTVVDPLMPPEDAEVGALITFEGHAAAPIAPGNRASKAFDRVADQLRTTQDGIARFEDVPFMTPNGPCVSPKGLVGSVS